MKINLLNRNKTNPLEQRINVSFKPENVDQLVNERLSKMSKRVKQNGFRPGKVPLSHMQAQYGSEIRAEVMADQMNKAYSEALKENELIPVDMANFEDVEQSDDKVSFTAIFETWPEIKLAKLEKIKVETQEVLVEDSDIDETIERIRTSRPSWSEVKRAAQNNDKVTFDFTGTLNGEPIKGGQSENFELILGEGQMIPGFEDNIIGLEISAEKTFDISFPEDYQATELAGQKTTFNIKLHKVEEKGIPELNEDFVKSIGIESGDLTDLKQDVKKRLNLQAEDLAFKKNREALNEALIKQHKFPIPEALIRKEIEAMAQYVNERQKQAKQPEQALDTFFTDENREEAIRRIQTGLLFRQVMDDFEIKPDEKVLEALIESEIANYPDPEQARQWLMNDQKVRANLENVAFERQLISFLLEKVTVKPQKVTLKSLNESAA